MTQDEILDAGHRNLIAFYRESALWGRHGSALDEDGVLCYATATRFPVMMNGVIRTDDRVSAADMIAKAQAYFDARGRGYTIWARTGRDEDISRAAGEMGLTPVMDTPEMLVRERLPDRAPPQGATIRRIESVGDVAAFAKLNGEAYSTYGMPPEVVEKSFGAAERFLAPHVRGVIAWIDGEPAAGALTYLSHGIAGVYWVGTQARYRGRGLAEAVTRVVTNVAFDFGARANTLQASVMGDPIYRRMGYEEVYRYSGYVRMRPGD